MFTMQGGDNWRKTYVQRSELCSKYPNCSTGGVIMEGHLHYVEKGTKRRLCWSCYEDAICKREIER